MTDISTLPLAQQIDQILQTSGKNRVQLLLQSQHIATIVPLLPAGELWLTVGEVGKNDAMQVMENATSEQWQTLFDLTAWDKDTLDPKKAVDWLQTMVDVNVEKASLWFRALDWDFAVLLTQSLITVAKVTDKEEDPVEVCHWPNELPPWTLDSAYYVQGLDEDRDMLARKLLRQVADDDIDFFHHLCDVIPDVLPTEQNEVAFETRERRLAEEGFPPYEEAVAIYQPISTAAVKSLPKRNPHLMTEGEKQIIPRFPLVACDAAPLFLAQVLATIQDGRFLQAFSIELASLANKVMIADQRPMAPQSLRESMAKVAAMMNLGVEAMSGNDVQRGAAVLQAYWAKDIFKVGVSVMRKLPLSQTPKPE